jgi:hypothetical protein
MALFVNRSNRVSEQLSAMHQDQPVGAGKRSTARNRDRLRCVERDRTRQRHTGGNTGQYTTDAMFVPGGDESISEIWASSRY